MQLRYLFSETGQGLRRNLSTTVALIVTMFISLTLVGAGLLLNSQAEKTENYLGDKLQITVYLCNQNMVDQPNCTSGDATPAQKDAIQEILETHPEVASYEGESKAEAYRTFQEIFVADSTTEEAYQTVRPKDMQESYRVTLKDPQEFEGVRSAVQGMDGVQRVQDLRQILNPIYDVMSWMKWGALGIAGFLLVAAILQVSNMIRLAAFARRREIGIMRLVGASMLAIQLPFLMETLFAAVIGLLLAGGALGLFMWFVVYRELRPNQHLTEWITWNDALFAGVSIAVLGILLTAIPTLLLTRKYLRV